MSSKNPQIYVGGLPYDIRESELRREFDRYGAIVNMSIKPKFAFIEFEDHVAARDAIDDLHRQHVFGGVIVVEQAKNSGRGPRDRDDRGGGGRRGDSQESRGRDRER